MKPLPRDAAVALIVAALLHLLPLPGLTGAVALLGLYDVSPLDAASELLLRHRALLFGLLGGGLLLGLRLPDWRAPLVTLTLLSDLGFLLLALATPLTPALQRVAGFDVLSLLLLGWVVWRMREVARAS